MSIFQPHRLNRMIELARSERVGLVMDYDSNSYTFGGTQQGFPHTLRNYAPIAGYVLGVAGQSAHNTTASPGQGAGDRWSARGTLISIGSTTGAPQEQEALFPRNGSAMGYLYLPDNSGVTAAGLGMRLYPFAGLDYRQALTIKHFGVSFDGSSGTQGLPYFLRNTNGNAQVGPRQTIEHAASAVGYTTHTFNLPADPARQALTTYELFYNVAPKVTQPIFLIGISVEATDLNHGWVVMTGLHMGGNSLAENLDDVLKSRQAYQARSNMLAEVVGSGGEVLRVKGIINDGSGRTTSASPARSGLVAGGTSTTVTLDDAAGISAGDLITVRDATTLGHVNSNASTSMDHREVQSVSVGTVTVTTAFSRTPLAGDVWRSSPAGTQTPTIGGFKAATQKYLEEFRAIDVAAGLQTTFFDLLQWKREDIVGQTFESQFEPASEELAAEHPDYVGSAPSNWYESGSQVAALSGVDPVHPGSYFLAAHLGRAISESAAASAAAGTTIINAPGLSSPTYARDATTISLPLQILDAAGEPVLGLAHDAPGLTIEWRRVGGPATWTSAPQTAETWQETGDGFYEPTLVVGGQADQTVAVRWTFGGVTSLPGLVSFTGFTGETGVSGGGSTITLPNRVVDNGDGTKWRQFYAIGTDLSPAIAPDGWIYRVRFNAAGEHPETEVASA